jgi:hypothetical protein
VSDTGVEDDDFLDGMCDLDFDNGTEVSDDDAPYVVLFASHLDYDLRVTDRAALLAKAEAWRTLFQATTT